MRAFERRYRRTIGFEVRADSRHVASLKGNQRLDYARLAEELAERAMCDHQALREALQFSGHGHAPFAEALVNANLVADWELSRVVCEIYGLPFLTVDTCEPDPRARAGIDTHFLLEHGLVPLSKFGGLLTVAMPGMVPAEVLGELAAVTDLTILPIVGSVSSNRRWIEQHLHAELVAALPKATPEAVAQANTEWSSIFDAGDAAVQLDLTPGESTQEH